MHVAASSTVCVEVCTALCVTHRGGSSQAVPTHKQTDVLTKPSQQLGYTETFCRKTLFGPSCAPHPDLSSVTRTRHMTQLVTGAGVKQADVTQHQSVII